IICLSLLQTGLSGPKAGSCLLQLAVIFLAFQHNEGITDLDGVSIVDQHASNPAIDLRIELNLILSDYRTIQPLRDRQRAKTCGNSLYSGNNSVDRRLISSS